MIEKFTKEEIDILRKELEEIDLQNKPRRKPYYLFYQDVYPFFSDRPGVTKTYTNSTQCRKNAAIAVLRSIDKITSYTLDCMNITIGGNANHPEDFIATVSDPKIPPEKYDEYCQMWEEIIEIVQNHIKPFTKRGRGKTWTF